MSDVEIIVCTTGTSGDIMPFLDMARTWVEMGRRVAFLANENWRSTITSTGAEFLAIAPEDPAQSRRDDHRFFLDNILPSYSHSFDFIRSRVESGARPWIVYRNNMLGSECAAEVFHLPSVKIMLQPSAVLSVDRPPWPWTSINRHPWQPVFRHIVAPLLTVAGALGSYRRITNQFRRSVGARPIAFRRMTEPAETIILFCPTWFALPQKDWAKSVRCVGFPVANNTPPEDDELTNFIEQNGPPLVFTPGTGVTDVNGFFSNAATVCSQLGIPGLFLSKHVPKMPANELAPILTRAYVDLAWLLPRSRLLMHHGGIGTTAQALRAGIPQIILPDRFDQPDNAMRIAELGLGAAIMTRNPSSSAVAETCASLLGDTSMSARLKKVSDTIARQNSLARALELIDQKCSAHA